MCVGSHVGPLRRGRVAWHTPTYLTIHDHGQGRRQSFLTKASPSFYTTMRSASLLSLLPFVTLACAQGVQIPLANDVYVEEQEFSASMVAELKAMDVVDAIRQAGRAAGYQLDEERLVQVFGEDSPRW
jgi:hypothetical protein